MANARGSVVLVDLSAKFANVAAVDTALAAAVAALASGFFPETISDATFKVSGGTFKSVLLMDCHKTPYQTWLTTSAAVFKCIDLSAYASVAAANTAIATAVDALESAATKSVRNTVILTLNIAGVMKKILIILSTNGTPATS